MPDIGHGEFFILMLVGAVVVIPVAALVIWLVRTEITLRQMRQLVAEQERQLAAAAEDRSEPDGPQSTR